VAPDCKQQPQGASSEFYLVEERRLKDAAEFSRALSSAIVRFSDEDATKVIALVSKISTHCARCEIRLTGQEFLIAGTNPEDEKPPKIQRVQLGYCARSDCGSNLYEVRYHRDTSIDWSAFFERMYESKSKVDETKLLEEAALRSIKQARLKKQLQQVAAGTVVIAGLLIMWQWNRGGRIPFLREPEKFRVTPLAAGQQEHKIRWRD
jgi:hypothetical protein